MEQPTKNAPKLATRHDPDQLRNYPYEAQERAAIYEYEAGMTREQAEARVIEEMKEKTSEQ